MADELIRLDTTIIGIDKLIAKAPTAAEANVLFKVKDVIYNQQRYFADAQPVKRGKWVQIGKQSAKCSERNGVLKSNGIDETGHANIFNAVYHYCPYCGAKMTKQ